MAAKKTITIGEKGFMRVQSLFERTEAVIGDVTGANYPFHLADTLLVDRRDALFLLGPEFIEL